MNPNQGNIPFFGKLTAYNQDGTLSDSRYFTQQRTLGNSAQHFAESGQSVKTELITQQEYERVFSLAPKIKEQPQQKNAVHNSTKHSFFSGQLFFDESLAANAYEISANSLSELLSNKEQNSPKLTEDIQQLQKTLVLQEQAFDEKTPNVRIDGFHTIDGEIYAAIEPVTYKDILIGTSGEIATKELTQMLQDGTLTPATQANDKFLLQKTIAFTAQYPEIPLDSLAALSKQAGVSHIVSAQQIESSRISIKDNAPPDFQIQAENGDFDFHYLLNTNAAPIRYESLTTPPAPLAELPPSAAFEVLRDTAMAGGFHVEPAPIGMDNASMHLYNPEQNTIFYDPTAPDIVKVSAMCTAYSQALIAQGSTSSPDMQYNEACLLECFLDYHCGLADDAGMTNGFLRMEAGGATLDSSAMPALEKSRKAFGFVQGKMQAIQQHAEHRQQQSLAKEQSPAQVQKAVGEDFMMDIN